MPTDLPIRRPGRFGPFDAGSSGAAMVVLLLTAGAARCETLPPTISNCNAAPAGSAVAFVQGQRPAIDLHATVERIVAQQPSVAWTYDLRDQAGSQHRLTWRSIAPIPRLEVNGTYDFHVEYVGGFPSASALVIRDDRGVLFLSATDQAPGQHVLKDGVPGFQFALEDAACPTRTHDRCYDAIFNQRLRVTRGSASVRLTSGQSEIVDGYRVHVLVAQKVVYNRNCADAGLDGVSFTISREK